MRDAIGGVVNISLITTFIAAVSGYLAFNVNYTKAFRMKNKIIDCIQRYEGDCGESTDCAAEIDEYRDKIGYSIGTLTEDGMTCPQGKGYCYQKFDAEGSDPEDPQVYYTVITKISFDFPIVRNLMVNFDALSVRGNTPSFSEQ